MFLVRLEEGKVLKVSSRSLLAMLGDLGRRHGIGEGMVVIMLEKDGGVKIEPWVFLLVERVENCMAIYRLLLGS
jgi:hypothetical protein